MPSAASSPAAGEQWRRLSPWCIPHFVVSRIAHSVQALLFGIPAGFGVSRTDFSGLIWQVPLGLAVWLTVWAVLQYSFTRYRVTASAVEMRRGALFRRHVNLAFERIQNVSIVEPFYFRPIAMANLSIDSAGSSGDEVEVAALSLAHAEELRTYIGTMRRLAGADAGLTPDDTQDAAQSALPHVGELFFTRSLRDLVIHGLTNNRAALVIAAIMGFFFQNGFSTADVAQYLGIDFDIVFAGLSLVRFFILAVLAFLLAIAVLALLSVLVSIVSYYGYSMYRQDRRLVVRRGLINRHEIAVRKSRIQSIRLSQDWLDYLLDRRNIYLEQLTHAQPGQLPGNKHVMVPSVRLSQTNEVTDEIWAIPAVEKLSYTPLNWRWFRKWAAILTLFGMGAVSFLAVIADAHAGVIAAAVAVWLALIAMAYMRWKRGGLAVDGDLIVARSGTVGIDYRIFRICKLQDVARVQTPFMRRHDLSSLEFMTAASKISVPYLPGVFARRVIDYSLFDVESRAQSWM